MKEWDSKLTLNSLFTNTAPLILTLLHRLSARMKLNNATPKKLHRNNVDVSKSGLLSYIQAEICFLAALTVNEVHDLYSWC